MNILIIGNMASGKTSLAEKLALKHSYEFFSIDEIRKTFSDGTFAGEFLAWHKMLEAIQHPQPDGKGIYEFSGTGKNAWWVAEAINYSRIHHRATWIIVYCLCEKEELLKRLKDKVYDAPLPFKFGTPESQIDFMSKDLSKNFGKGYWHFPEITIRTDQLNLDESVTKIEEVILSHYGVVLK